MSAANPLNNLHNALRSSHVWHTSAYILSNFLLCSIHAGRVVDEQDDRLGAKGPEIFRLRPEMSSRALLVLAFVRDYIGRWQRSPSYGEIANHLMISPALAKKAVKSLARDGLLLRTPGPRGLALPSERDAALRVLRALGWGIDEAQAQLIRPVDAEGRVPNRTLLPPPALDYVPCGSVGGGDGDSRGEQGGEGAITGQ